MTGKQEQPVGSFGNPYLYKSYYYDVETGLYYLNARYYDPSIGRFLSKDPNGGDQRDRLEQNPYLYVKNNPVNSEDPSGLKSAYWYYRHNKYMYEKTGKLRYKARMNRWYSKWTHSKTKNIDQAAYQKAANQKKADRAKTKAAQALEKGNISGYLKYKDQVSSYQQKVNYWSGKLKEVKQVRRNIDYNVHDKGTYRWARDLGFTSDQARIIAQGSKSVDSGSMKDDRSRHRNTFFWNWIENKLYGESLSTSQEYWARKELNTAIKNHDLKALGRGVHSVQDQIKHSDRYWMIDEHFIGFFARYDPDRYVYEDELGQTTKDYLQSYLRATR